MDRLTGYFLTLILIITYNSSRMLCAQDWTLDSTQWIEFQTTEGFELDLRYATSDNFTDHVIYECGRCFLRPDAASALERISKELLEKGFRVKLFDCYRPLAVQWELWEEVPDPNYVADPRKGSMHNRGQAIDVTLVDIKTGKELNMGTDFDFFGPRAYHSSTSNLSNEIQQNRHLLKTVMMKHGFQPIRTEWWHYSYRKKTWPIFEEKWSCIE